MGNSVSGENNPAVIEGGENSPSSGGRREPTDEEVEMIYQALKRAFERAADSMPGVDRRLLLLRVLERFRDDHPDIYRQVFGSSNGTRRLDTNYFLGSSPSNPIEIEDDAEEDADENNSRAGNRPSRGSRKRPHPDRRRPFGGV